MKAIGYVRVSTEKQADSGVSLDAQCEKIRAMATLKDAELVDIIIDAGESAKNLRRPGVERLLSLVASGQVDCVIVCKLDRLTRSVKDLAHILETFERRKVSLVSVAESLDTATAAGRLVLNIMVSVSQWEREAISERTKDAMSHKKAQRQCVGNIQFGYRLGSDGAHVEADPSEQSVLASISELRTSGKSFRGIASDLNRRGLTTRKGGAWRHQYVAAIAA